MKKGVDYVGLTVSYLCHDGKGNYLMNKRSVNCRDEHGCWDFGGGGVDFGDTIEDTLKKELKEEYCVDPINFKFLDYFNLFREDKGVKTHWLSLVFLVEIDHKKAQNGEPHKFDELRWVRLDDIPQPLHTGWKIMLPRLIDILPR